MNKTVRSALLILLLAALGGGIVYTAALRRAQSAKRPNIILISLDTLRADRLGVYGYRRGTSPFIDSLAEQVYENISHGKRYDIPAIREYLDGQAG